MIVFTRKSCDQLTRLMTLDELMQELVINKKINISEIECL